MVAAREPPRPKLGTKGAGAAVDALLNRRRSSMRPRLALANEKSEPWVQDRTGHRSSDMINLYRGVARTAAELRLGELLPMNEAIPECGGKSRGFP